MSKFYRKSVIIEEVPAWQECDVCTEAGKGEIITGLGGGIKKARGGPVVDSFPDPLGVRRRKRSPCSACHGKGGKWHEATQLASSWDQKHSWRVIREYKVESTSVLFREHEVCRGCKGKREVYDLQLSHVVFHSPLPRIPCSRCLKDAEGKPTGAEPGTAGEWRVKG